MATITFDTLELTDALKKAGIPPEQAEAVVRVIAKARICAAGSIKLKASVLPSIAANPAMAEALINQPDSVNKAIEANAVSSDRKIPPANQVLCGLNNFRKNQRSFMIPAVLAVILSAFSFD